MAKKINWTFSALEMLQDVYEYREQYSEDSADKYIDKIFDFSESFSTFPNAYPVCRFEIFAQKGYRCAVFQKQYIIVYKVDIVIDIVAIIHASKDIDAIEFIM